MSKIDHFLELYAATVIRLTTQNKLSRFVTNNRLRHKLEKLASQLECERTEVEFVLLSSGATVYRDTATPMTSDVSTTSTTQAQTKHAPKSGAKKARLESVLDDSEARAFWAGNFGKSAWQVPFDQVCNGGTGSGKEGDDCVSHSVCVCVIVCDCVSYTAHNTVRQHTRRTSGRRGRSRHIRPQQAGAAFTTHAHTRSNSSANTGCHDNDVDGIAQ
jgi:hypothetical protein